MGRESMFYVLGAVFLAMGVYDLAMHGFYGAEQTLSHQILVLSRAYPVIPFLAGMLCAHFFWSQSP